VRWAALLAILVALVACPAQADDEVGGVANGDFFDLTAVGGGAPSSVHQAAFEGPMGGSQPTYSLESSCQRGDGITRADFYGCGGQVSCGAKGVLFNVWAYYGDGTNELIGQQCVEPEQAAALQATVTGDAVLRAFRRIRVPDSEVVIQPPGGKTLVNLDTVFSTQAEGFTRTIGLLGHRVELDITPSEFRWVNGDGTVQVTDWAGRPWREGTPLADLITHRYDDAVHGLRPRVDTTWSARYRVDGGPWREVPGTVTITGSSYDLAVLSAWPALVG